MPVVEKQPVDAGRQKRPLRLKLCCKFGKFRPGPLGDAEVDGRKRVFFKRDKMQTPAALWVGAPGLPGGEKVQAQPKAGFQDDKTVAPLPALRQVVAAEKDMACLRRAAMRRVVNVAKGA